MGVGSSREIEEQLEAALALLDAARAKQEQLRSENDALQARITAQAASLLLHEDQAKGGNGLNVHLVQQREPLSKRVLFSMAVVGTLATDRFTRCLGLQEVLRDLSIVDYSSFFQALCLSAVFILLLRYRRYKWRRIRPEVCNAPLLMMGSPGLAEGERHQKPARTHTHATRVRCPFLLPSLTVPVLVSLACALLQLAAHHVPRPAAQPDPLTRRDGAR